MPADTLESTYVSVGAATDVTVAKFTPSVLRCTSYDEMAEPFDVLAVVQVTVSVELPADTLTGSGGSGVAT